INIRKVPSTFGVPYHNLLIGGIDRGTNFLKPTDKLAYGNPDKNLSRMPTTYYHPDSPIGVVLRKLNWFPGQKNTYAADARPAVTLAGLGAVPPGSGLPDAALTALWSEPPIGVVTMYAGTPAAYARPLQTMDFYENNSRIIDLSLPKKGEPWFTYI